MGEVTELRRLYLHGNDLTGEIPAELGNLSQLQYVQLYGNDLTGQIPVELGDLSRLKSLYLNEELGDLDYLVIDLPPGTSDSPLTVMQSIPMDGFVVVTTPQDLAKIDAKRSINMIRTLQVDVLGIVENMSGEVFGSGAGEELAREMDLGFLGRLEMRTDYRDTSKPAVLNSDAVLSEYEHVADETVAALGKLTAAAT